MKPIQPVLITLLVLAAALCVWSLRSRLITRIVAVVLAALGVAFVIHPELTGSLAQRLGVGRGADLILYLFSMAAIYAFLALYARLRAIQRNITELARHYAIEHAQVHTGSPSEGQRQPS